LEKHPEPKQREVQFTRAEVTTVSEGTYKQSLWEASAESLSL